MLIFQPAVLVLSAVAMVLTIVLGLLQVGSWIIDEDAVWILWVAIAVLVVALLLLLARHAAVKENAKAKHEAEIAQLVKAAEDADAAQEVKITQLVKAAEEANIGREIAEAAVQQTGGLSDLDQDLAKQLWEHASAPETLTVLGSFFPYAIPREAVRSMEALSNLPMTRTPHDAELAQHLNTLSEAARLWVSKLLPLVSTDGDNFSTKLDSHVSADAYKKHDDKTKELGDVGFELHEKLLEYQRYYASL